MTTISTAPLTRSRLRSRIAKLPRMHIAHLPTPLEEMPRLSAELGGPRILVKREDMTGLAYGGNALTPGAAASGALWYYYMMATKNDGGASV